MRKIENTPNVHRAGFKIIGLCSFGKAKYFVLLDLLIPIMNNSIFYL